jgi:hypothetical protein
MRERRRSSSSSGSLARPLARDVRRAGCAEREGGKGAAGRVENFISKSSERQVPTYVPTNLPTYLEGKGTTSLFFSLAIYSEKAIFKTFKMRKSGFFGVFSSQNLTKVLEKSPDFYKWLKRW